MEKQQYATLGTLSLGFLYENKQMNQTSSWNLHWQRDVVQSNVYYA
jgi:hypothetical protein